MVAFLPLVCVVLLCWAGAVAAYFAPAPVVAAADAGGYWVEF